MKKIINYQCEVCGNIYETETDAVKCEKKGPVNLDKWKPGLLYRYIWNSEMGGIFALAHVRVSSYSKHNVVGSFWACRNWSSYIEGGDNLGPNFYCTGPELSDDFNSGITSADLELPEMGRMLEYLKSIGVEPYIMIGGHAHPLSFITEK